MYVRVPGNRERIETLMTDNVCYVHAEDWQSIGFLPVEKIHAGEAWLDEARKDASLLPFSVNLDRAVPVEVIEAALSPYLTRADQLLTGYANDLQVVADGFAYYDDDFGAVYGIASGGMVKELYFANMFCDCGKDFRTVMQAVEAFGQAHQLVMFDWELLMLVDLRQPGAIQAYYDEM